MKSVYMRKGSTWTVSNEAAMDIHHVLPPGNYTVCVDKYGTFFLETSEPFKMPKKLYGETNSNAKRILETFKDRPNITGVLLEGEKGSGKTLLAKQLAVLAKEEGIPTLLINAGYCGAGFNQFIQSIEQPAILLFDEFEKTYDKEQQQAMLTFLDGVFPTKKLCLLTVNNRWLLDSHMMNRPGRLFYMLPFTGLSRDFIQEYCEDRLDSKKHIDGVQKIALMFQAFNFDQLQALVEEMNRYKEDPFEALKMLNVRPESDSDSNFDVELEMDGKLVNLEPVSETVWHGNPLSPNCLMNFTRLDDEKLKIEYRDAVFHPRDFVSVEASKGIFIFKNIQGDRLRLKRQERRMYNRHAF